MAFALGRCTHLLSRNVVAEGAATHARISPPIKYHKWTSSTRGHATRLVSYQKAGAAQLVTKVQAETRRPSKLGWEQQLHISSSGRSLADRKSNVPPTNDPEAGVAEKLRASLAVLKPHENIYNLPNILTVSRLVAAPVTAYLLLHDHHQWALALFAYAGITDLVDGWLARRWKLQTVAGSVIDPMADKALMIILTVTLAIKGAIPLYLATLILGRDASLAVAAIYYRYASLPTPKTFMRYWDFSLPSAEVHPTTVSKYNTFLQLILIGLTLALPVVTHGGAYAGLLQNIHLDDATLHQGISYFQWLVAGTTAWSGLSYAFLKNVVTFLGPDEKLKAKQGARGRAIIGVTFGSVVAAAIYIALTRGEIQPPIDIKDEDEDDAAT